MYKLRHFTEEENFGDYSRMSGFVLWLIDELRDRYQEEFVIHYGFATSGHSEKSKHYTGEAIDFHIKTRDNLRQQFEIMESYLEDLQVENRVGLGVYDWGFHIDSRGERARWARHSGGEYIGIKDFFIGIKFIFDDFK